MEKRIGGALILIERPASVPQLNQILSDHGGIILARQGLPLTDRGLRIISLVLEGTNDRIGSLAGKVGRLPGVTIKTLLSATKEARHGSPPSRPSDRNPDEPPSTDAPPSSDTHSSTEGRPSSDDPSSSDAHPSTEGPG
ncbi:TM1266 family iron-only hydrogenase system putative regulator [Spirochaeta lutea]|uniref:TM1266 family iron-only hydrogenase system putative regulator n=1 Tax=Spirochaeta lutea TaxID=1480694 RepID=UPI0009DF860F|nr:TM1266 family iron-only hydrogenase system putative regulator [Spirochaeta lutea]